MADKTLKKGAGVHLTTGAICIALTLLGAFLFSFSYTTNYYIYGQMNSVLITVLLACAVIAEIASVILVKKHPDAVWARLLTLLVTALLAASAMFIVGDRVEGIGNCIITDYDSGHGGEEAIYMSLGAAVVLLIAMVYNIIGSFSKAGNAPAGRAKKLALITSGAVLGLASIIAVLGLTGVFSKNAVPAAGGQAATGEADAVKGAYSVSFNAGNENLDKVQDYQFQCSNFGGFLVYDTRFTVDLKLDLDGAGNYTLTSDAYVVENGQRAVKDDGTGLGMISLTTAEGTYTINDDGTVTTSVPSHAVYQMETDTYSEQMKGAANMNVEGNSEDGTYDSSEYPGVLSFVPETTWTISGDQIEAYRKAPPKGTFTVSFNQMNENLDRVQDYQFLGSNFGGILQYDTRFYVDLKLDLDGAGSYKLTSEAYCIENGKRAEIGDETGLGQNINLTAEGTYVVNDDGTVTTAVPSHAVFVMETDTYSVQMKGAVGMNVGGNDADGTYDSSEYPEVLDFAPETIWTLSGSSIEAYCSADAPEEAEEEQPVEEEMPTEQEAEETAEPANEGAVIPSDDGGTEMTFYADGTYRFWFAGYSIEDLGTYTYKDGILTLTDANGKESVGEGEDPIKLHYAYSASDQLTGDYTIPASTFVFSSAESEAEETAEAAKEGAVISSDDGGTEMTFYPDGTYRFWFGNFSIEDLGTYTYKDDILTLTDVNGKESVGEGKDPIKLHYAYSASDQLTGDYTIPASTFDFAK